MSALHQRRLVLAAVLPLTATAALVGLPAIQANAVSTTIVIHEVYGGGGNTGAPLDHDFIELTNLGSSTVDVSDWSVQYASATGTTYTVTNLTGQVPAGETYLVQEASGANGGPLPAPDATGSINLSGTNGKVALVSNQTALACGADCDQAAGVVDFIGYGTANDFETAAAPAGSNTTSLARGGADSDNNAADFTAGSPSPVGCGDPCLPPSQPATIAQIQGAGHLSPLNGDSVTDVAGVITARASNGFYMQDPDGSDIDGASSGILVFTGAAGLTDAMIPGTAVTVDGSVTEFRPGSTGLTVTELGTPTVHVGAAGQPLPAATLVGPGGLSVPATVIDDDAAPGTQINVETQGTYQPDDDGIDFWESLEGMRVELDDARVVGPTNVAFGETPIVPAGSGIETERGGIVLRQSDPNPERIVLDNSLGTTVPKANVGDTYAGPTVGVLSYDFNNFHLLATQRPTLSSGGITREVATASTHDELSIATFNVENLDPTDPQSKFDDLAEIIVHNLAAPDLLALEEVQDNDGPTDSGTTDADLTLQQLVDAISAAGGPAYTWEQINPRNDQEGGEPGGNIRVAFLIQQGTPLSFVERDPGTSSEDTDVTAGPDGAELTHSPGRVDPDNAAWVATRVPLAGEFMFGTQKVFVVANHWSSKGGDQPLFGPNQPPLQASETKRVTQAETVNSFVHEITAADADANVVVLGDLNDFEYSDSVTALTEDGALLDDLPATLPDAERYTYDFEGNSQVLDHILLSSGASTQGFDYDVVHVNAEFNDQASDHDPQVVDLHLGLPAADATLAATPSTIVFGQSSTIHGVLTDHATGDPIAGATVELQSRGTAADPWAHNQNDVTAADGSYSFSVQANRRTSYRVVWGGNTQFASTQSQSVVVKVAPRVTLEVSDRTVKKGTTVLFTGIVAPNHAGQRVSVQHRRNGSWVTVATPKLDQDSLYRFRWTASPKGASVWRVVKPADGDHVQGVSRTVSVTVH
ncbi:MAG TPA: lamin tail domain-containing protein [Nocardioidaceae bacterium]